VFPNNWVSLHADGTVVLYPMLAPSRRRERRLELLIDLERRGGYRVERLLDLTYHELRGHFLEGTGSVVFDHVTRTAYACRSPRTDTEVLEDLCAEMGYAPVAFERPTPAGVPVYHTNVMLSIGSGYALVCAQRCRCSNARRCSNACRQWPPRAHDRPGADGGVRRQRTRAAGRRRRARVDWMCRALDSLLPVQREALTACVDRVVAVPVRPSKSSARFGALHAGRDLPAATGAGRSRRDRRDIP